jgi:hypothetical protein
VQQLAVARSRGLYEPGEAIHSFWRKLAQSVEQLLPCQLKGALLSWVGATGWFEAG